MQGRFDVGYVDIEQQRHGNSRQPLDNRHVATCAVQAQGAAMKFMIIGLTIAIATAACTVQERTTVQPAPVAATTTTYSTPATASTTTVTTPAAPAATTTVYTR
jgi:hypothetical protein